MNHKQERIRSNDPSYHDFVISVPRLSLAAPLRLVAGNRLDARSPWKMGALPRNSAEEILPRNCWNPMGMKNDQGARRSQLVLGPREIEEYLARFPNTENHSKR